MRASIKSRTKKTHRGLFFVPLRRRRNPRKSGRQAIEGKPQRVKICDFVSRGSFSKEGAAELFSGKRSNDEGVKFSDDRRKPDPVVHCDEGLLQQKIE